MDCLDGDDGYNADVDADYLTPPSSKESVLQCIFAGSDSKEQSRSITTLPFAVVSDCYNNFFGGDNDNTIVKIMASLYSHLQPSLMTIPSFL